MNNTEYMRLTTTGLGIGTSSPSTLLTLNDGSNSRTHQIEFRYGDTASHRIGRSNSTGNLEFTNLINNHGFTFKNSGAGTLRFNVLDMNVGIGTSSPDANLTVNGAASFAAGTALLPSIARSGDLNTGFWFPAADTIAASTAGSERLRIDSSGNVGIGTSSPLTKLDVKFATDKHALFTASASYSNGADLIATNDLGSEIALGLGGNTVRFYTGATERARIDSSGNLGLGVTPSAWQTIKALQVNQASFGGYSNDLYAYANAYYGSGGWRYINTAVASGYEQVSGAHKWYNAPSGTAGDAISFSQAMTLDASGNLGVGTTSPRDPGAGFKGITLNGSTSGYFDLNTNGTRIFTLFGSGNDILLTNPTATGSMQFYTNNTERARIDSSGNLLVGTTGAAQSDSNSVAVRNIDGSSGPNCLQVSHIDGTASGVQYGYFIYDGIAIGSISQSGTTAVLYNTTSDYRLKTVIAPVDGAGERIDALRPVEYNWNDTGSRSRGFLAHEFQEVYANSVTGEKDAVDDSGKPVYQSMQASTSEVIADLVAEIQSLRARVAQLESNK
jgi:hypothetical protein